MNLFDNLSQLSKRGLLEVPNPKPKYQIVQFPKDFIKVEDTERVFGTVLSAVKENLVADNEGMIAVSTGEWGSTFQKQIGRTSCGLASALGYTRQMPLPNLSITGKEHLDNFTASNITWKKEGMKMVPLMV